MHKKTTKISIIIVCFTIIFSLLNITIHATENVNDLYFQSFIFPEADKYVEENIGDMINSESKIVPIDIEKVKVGRGIYVADNDKNEALPTFYYPVYIGENLTYVYRIFDSGTGKYEGVFSKNYVNELLNNAGTSRENAPLWTANNGNEILLTSTSTKVIFKSKFGNLPKKVTLPDYLKKRSIDLEIINVREKIPFNIIPQTRAGYWVRTISYVEHQGNNNWCAAYVTAAAIREMASTPSMRASTIMGYFGKGTNEACTDAMISQYSARYGITYTGRYYGVIYPQSLYNELENWNLVYGSYQSNGDGHALLLHGVDGNKARIWNPWNEYSEWISSISVYYGGGTTWSMRGYGFYRK